MVLWRDLSLLSFITLLTSLATLTCLHWSSTNRNQYQESLPEEIIGVRSSYSYFREYKGYRELSTTGDVPSMTSIEQRLNHTSETGQTEAQLPTGKSTSITQISRERTSPAPETLVKNDNTKHPEVSLKAPADIEILVKYDHTQQPVVPKPARGYALAQDYWEQQTSGSRNLQNLQCWAGQLNLSVVEPFIVNSVLQTPLSNTHMKHDSEMLHFSDLFDLLSWNKYSENLHHSQLVSWEDFMQHAPRDVILVSIRYENALSVKKTQQLVQMNPSNYPPPSERYKMGCHKAGWPIEKQHTFLTSNHFKVVREVCFNFEYGDRLTTEVFNNHIYAGHMPSGTTVIFKQWRGTGPASRIIVGDSTCHNTLIQEHIHPSLRLIKEAKRYREKYLNGGKYIAIIARLEKSKITLHRAGIVTYCLGQIVHYQDSLRAESGTNTTFLSIDIGKYGSNSFRNTGDDKDLQVEFGKFFRQLYGDSLSITEWEKMFEDTSQTTDSGYIALLQQTIATQADCVIFVGGGAFQKHALRLYKELHPIEDNRCIRIINECTPAANLSL